MFAPEELEKVPGIHEAQTAKLVAPAKESIKALQTYYGVRTECSIRKYVTGKAGRGTDKVGLSRPVVTCEPTGSRA